MSQYLMQNSDLILKLTLAVLLGTLIGVERVLVHKDAGMKTHALVSMGAAVFVLVSEAITQKYINLPGMNPMMMPSQIIVGVGFLGAGSIMLQGSRLTGLTTAGGLWVTAGIGMAVGFGLFSIATISTVLVLFILIATNVFEEPLRKISNGNGNGNGNGEAH